MVEAQHAGQAPAGGVALAAKQTVRGVLAEPSTFSSSQSATQAEVGSYAGSVAFGASLWFVILIIAFFSWFYPGRIFRGEVLSLKEREFVRLAVVAGCSKWTIMRRHILPNVASALIGGVDKNNDRNPNRRILFMNCGGLAPELTNEQCSFWHWRFDLHVAMKAEVMSRAVPKDVTKVYMINQDYLFGQSVQRDLPNHVDQQSTLDDLDAFVQRRLSVIRQHGDRLLHDDRAGGEDLPGLVGVLPVIAAVHLVDHDEVREHATAVDAANLGALELPPEDRGTRLE